MSSSGASSFEDLTNADRLDVITEFNDYPEMELKLKKVLQDDSTYGRYMIFSPRVMNEVTKLLKVSEISEFSYESGTETLVWMTTTCKEINRMLKGKTDLCE
eukprot:1860660-Amphidinium_carterae.1